jgi:hypothetical protein
MTVRVLLDVGCKLLEVSGACRYVRFFFASIGMQVVHVHVQPRGKFDPCHGEALYPQAVGGPFATHLPRDAAELVEREALQDAKAVTRLQHRPVPRHVDTHRLRAKSALAWQVFGGTLG